MSFDEFGSDCDACAALCCVAYAFDRGDSFGHDKPAGVSCHHLRGNRCAIHKNLAEQGYGGCIAYECLGAGPRITALFASDFAYEPMVTGRMLDAFREMRRLQELKQMVMAASRLPLDAPTAVEQSVWRDRLFELSDSAEGVEAFEREGVAGEVRAWLKGLARFVAP